MRNIELKARLADLEAARRVAVEVATERAGVQHQVDTYFHVAHGRLKLREIAGAGAQLVWYERPDEEGPKESDYRLVSVPDAEGIKAALTGALGVRVVVSKRREIFLARNVRIHLDEVDGLGTFLEFEAVLGPDVDDAAGRQQVDDLMRRFGIRADDLLPGSYADLLRPVP